MRLFAIFCLFISHFCFAQPAPSGGFTAPITSLYADTTPNLDFLPKKKRDFKIKEKKIPKSLFYGIKTKRGFTITGKGKAKVTELFYFVPVWKEPDPYIPIVYWYNMKKRKVLNTPILEKDKKYARLLHGPYLKKTTYSILEDGIFYMGSKHGRWEKYDKGDVLVEKIKYFRGWTRESIITYFDQDRKKIQEIMPIQNGTKTGKYYKYYESGLIAEDGQFAENEKIGTWVEYFDDRKKRKRQTQYPNDPYDKKTEVKVVKEWDETGRITFDKTPKDSGKKRVQPK